MKAVGRPRRGRPTFGTGEPVSGCPRGDLNDRYDWRTEPPQDTGSTPVETVTEYFADSGYDLGPEHVSAVMGESACTGPVAVVVAISRVHASSFSSAVVQDAAQATNGTPVNRPERDHDGLAVWSGMGRHAPEHQAFDVQAQNGRVSIPRGLATHRRHPVSASVVRSACVAAQRMVLGDFHESDSEAVGIFDPHLDQSPGLPSGWLCDRHAGGRKPLVLRGDVPHLHPERQTHRWLLGLTGDLEQTAS